MSNSLEEESGLYTSGAFSKLSMISFRCDTPRFRRIVPGPPGVPASRRLTYLSRMELLSIGSVHFHF